jgi:hypothetical protein
MYETIICLPLFGFDINIVHLFGVRIYKELIIKWLKYLHNVEEVHKNPPRLCPLLTALMLSGRQTYKKCDKISFTLNMC